jgi:hypothetical protein
MSKKTTVGLCAAAVVLLTIVTGVSYGQAVPAQPLADTVFHRTTEWTIKPSQAFDVLCLLNTLTADPYYQTYYSGEYAKLAPKLTPEALAALAELKRKIKDEGHGIISAMMCLYFSATIDSTLDELIATVKAPVLMQSELRKTTYYSDDGWKLFESVRRDLGVILRCLKQTGFEDYWLENVLPKVQGKIAVVDSSLPRYNIVPEIENLLGTPLASNKITVYMLYYSQPHGIKVTGTRFLTDAAWPFKIVIRNAVHEMMHPPYHPEGNQDLSSALNSLQKDDFLMDKVLHHSADFGYNTFDGFIEEDCVQALDQIINEKLGVANDARKRWKENDDGMHVFAVALYQVMKAENYNAGREAFDKFLVRVINSGKLGAGSIKKYYDTFYDLGK